MISLTVRIQSQHLSLANTTTSSAFRALNDSKIRRSCIRCCEDHSVFCVRFFNCCSWLRTWIRWGRAFKRYVCWPEKVALRFRWIITRWLGRETWNGHCCIYYWELGLEETPRKRSADVNSEFSRLLERSVTLWMTNGSVDDFQKE